MTFEPNATARYSPRALVRMAGKAAAALFVVAALIQISWNMFAPKLFAAEALHMHEALGLALFATIVALGLRFAIGRVRRG